jgi:hypothetical protein
MKSNREISSRSAELSLLLRKLSSKISPQLAQLPWRLTKNRKSLKKDCLVSPLMLPLKISKSRMKSMILKSMRRLRASLTLLLTIRKRVLTLMICTMKRSQDAGSVGTQLLLISTPFSQFANAQDLSDTFILSA